MTVVRAGLLSLCLAAAAVTPAAGQVYIGGDGPRRGSIEVSGGGTWASGFDLPTLDARLTRAVESAGFDLFSVSGRVEGFPGVQVRVGVYLSPTISVEGGARYARPRLAFDLSGDAESAEDTTATETLSHYVFDGSVLFHFPKASFSGGRGVPFLSAGGGYLRELHDGNELVETGNEIHATAGVKYWFGTGRRRWGLRGEAGLSSRQDGFDRDGGRRTLPLVQGGVTFLF
jgi:hypothetical protein